MCSMFISSLFNFHSICSIPILLVQTHFCGWQTSDKVERQTLISAKCSRKVSNHLPPKYIECKIKYIRTRWAWIFNTFNTNNHQWQFDKDYFLRLFIEVKGRGKILQFGAVTASFALWTKVMHCGENLVKRNCESCERPLLSSVRHFTQQPIHHQHFDQLNRASLSSLKEVQNFSENILGFWGLLVHTCKNVWCCGEGYFGQKKMRKKCVNRDKM